MLSDAGSPPAHRVFTREGTSIPLQKGASAQWTFHGKRKLPFHERRNRHSQAEAKRPGKHTQAVIRHCHSQLGCMNDSYKAAPKIKLITLGL